MFDNVNVRDLENTHPSWISDHLGERSYMDTETRLPEADETIASTRPGEVAFYEATFQADRLCNVSPILTKHEQERFDQISRTLEQEQFYTIKDILRLKSFLGSFALDLEKMASSGVDNAEEKNTCDEVHVATNEGESLLSRGDAPEEPYSSSSRSILISKAWSDSRLPPKLRSDEMSKKMDLEKLAQLAKAKGKPRKDVTSTGEKGIHIGTKRAQYETPNISSSKKGKQASDTKKKGSMDKRFYLQIDHDLVDEDEEEEKDVPDTNTPQ
ncbi:hypothetical protein Acr_27g0002370 [Actinidia rufa]|uniref:Uncharacterized protein n=1 Tax=Actinidia rufa TaxID=165716 RepID=A0A7J0H642_9ERIC|nr:hypothetical protein Acr_27g0002370 [Actinidia rufa]